MLPSMSIALEHGAAALTVYERAAAGEAWRGRALQAEDTLPIPELGIAIPVAEFYQAITFPADADRSD